MGAYSLCHFCGLGKGSGNKNYRRTREGRRECKRVSSFVYIELCAGLSVSYPVLRGGLSLREIRELVWSCTAKTSRSSSVSSQSSHFLHFTTLNSRIQKELKGKTILNAHHLSWLKNQASKQTDLVYVVSLCIMACLERGLEQGLPNKATSVFCFLETFLKRVWGDVEDAWIPIVIEIALPPGPVSWLPVWKNAWDGNTHGGI